MVTASSLAAPLGAELVEECLECVGVLSRVSPDNVTTFVVDDHGDVLVVASVRQLVDADVREPVEQIWALPTCNNALDDRPDGVPRHAHHVADRRLVATLGEATDVVLERACEPRARLGPGDLLDLDAASRALDATRVVAKVQRHPGEVEMAPPATTVAVVARAGLPALGAAATSPGRRDVDYEPLLVEVHVEHTGPFQTQQGTE